MYVSFPDLLKQPVLCSGWFCVRSSGEYFSAIAISSYFLIFLLRYFIIKDTNQDIKLLFSFDFRNTWISIPHRMKQFSMATFNVHMWCDANHMDNYERVRDLVKLWRIFSYIVYMFKVYKIFKKLMLAPIKIEQDLKKTTKLVFWN